MTPPEHPFLGVPALVWQILNLSTFLVLLYFLLRRPTAGFFTERRKKIEEALRKAEADRLSAEKLAADIADRLTKIETELAALHQNAARESEAERTSLRAQAEEEARQILVRASSEVESRVKEARRDLTTYAADLALDSAERIVIESLTSDDQLRLVREGVSGLKSVAALERSR